MKTITETGIKRDAARRTSDPGTLLLIVYIGIILLFLLIGGMTRAEAQDTSADLEKIHIDDIRQGELLYAHEGSDTFSRTALLSQQVKIAISGMLADVTLTQRFQNDTARWIEAVYVFPLPEESAVTGMRMVIGDRVVVGRIKEKKAAQQVYEQARREGKKTSLLVRQRPNIFTMAVANIPPGETIEVILQYVDAVLFENDLFTYRFPLVVAPRYIPGTSVSLEEERIDFTEGGWAVNTDQVDDASRITPPVAAPFEPARNPVELSLSLAPGFAVQDLASLYHGVAITQQEDAVHVLTFDGRVYADRDFVVQYRASPSEKIHAALFTEAAGGENFAYLMFVPPSAELGGRNSMVPREIIFVLDISGSMAGSSIRQAQEAVQYAISRLQEQDTFNIIVFNNTASKVYHKPLAATAQNRETARRQVGALEASGGTEIASALNLALDGRKDRSRIRQLVFLTDGAVGNEAALLRRIVEGIGDSVLFTVGIGSAPNSYFMREAAQAGRGSFCYIGGVDEVGEKMTSLLHKLEKPVTTDLQVLLPGNGDIEIYPQPLPDLYAGQPVIALLRSTKPFGTFQLSGSGPEKQWRVAMDGTGSMERPGIATLWAGKKIAALMSGLHFGEPEDKVREQVLQTALHHQLVSRYTSLVAVDETVSRPVEGSLERQQLKTNLPHGWQHQAVFATAAQTATRSAVSLAFGISALLLGMVFLLLKRRWI
ncbi:MAG: marine proteobacterial sortase target protein [Desulfopila sp.]|jgi:Ca-activated chloride channel family protein|nr:marine proteobacterial sortase target protein [Desulfopila sp.]